MPAPGLWTSAGTAMYSLPHSQQEGSLATPAAHTGEDEDFLEGVLQAEQQALLAPRPTTTGKHISGLARACAEASRSALPLCPILQVIV